MYKTSKYYSYIFYADRNVRPCTILGYTLTTFPKSHKTLMHNKSNRDLWHNCKRNERNQRTNKKLHLNASRRILQCTLYTISRDGVIDIKRQKTDTGIQYRHEKKEDTAGFIPKPIARPVYGTVCYCKIYISDTYI